MAANDINVYSRITPEIERLADEAEDNDAIDSSLYTTLDVKRGLRDLNGKGVLAGLTNISEVRAKKKLPDGTEESDYGSPISSYSASFRRKGSLRLLRTC